MAPPALPDHLMNKNRLQEYTQKSGIQLPIYQTVNEGYAHAPKFRASVLVDGKKYTSNLTFVHRKDAEQEVAKLALEHIKENMKDKGCPLTLIHQDLLACKSILHEFACKSNLNIPEYKTTSAEGQGMVFVSSLLLSDKTYTGDVAGSKKVAEQLAARTAIESLLGSDIGTELTQIIKSKAKLNSSSDVVQYSGRPEIILPIADTPECSPRRLTNSRVLNSHKLTEESCRITGHSSGGKRGPGIKNLERIKKMRRDED